MYENKLKLSCHFFQLTDSAITENGWDGGFLLEKYILDNKHVFKREFCLSTYEEGGNRIRHGRNHEKFIIHYEENSTDRFVNQFFELCVPVKLVFVADILPI